MPDADRLVGALAALCEDMKQRAENKRLTLDVDGACGLHTESTLHPCNLLELCNRLDKAPEGPTGALHMAWSIFLPGGLCHNRVRHIIAEHIIPGLFNLLPNLEGARLWAMADQAVYCTATEHPCCHAEKVYQP